METKFLVVSTLECIQKLKYGVVHIKHIMLWTNVEIINKQKEREKERKKITFASPVPILQLSQLQYCCHWINDANILITLCLLFYISGNSGHLSSSREQWLQQQYYFEKIWH